MQTLSRKQTKDLIESREDVVVIETLDKQQYRKFHLPGAHNIPLDESFEENVRSVAPDSSAPILVYCMDSECAASARAAEKLEELGYTNVSDYEAGKVDWKEAGLPIE